MPNSAPMSNSVAMSRSSNNDQSKKLVDSATSRSDFRLSDTERIQHILYELSKQKIAAKPSKTNETAVTQAYKIDKKGQQTLIDYANEITRSIIESASVVADHRSSSEIETSDVALILAKKTRNRAGRVPENKKPVP